MKTLLFILVSLTIIVTLSLLSVEGYAGTLRWRLYDNFDKGVIDPDRWDIDSTSADISIVDGRAQFVHNPGFPDDNSWLKFKKGVKKIKGIRATVTVESCTGDVLVRVAARIGEAQDGYVWNHLCLQGGVAEPRIFGDLRVLEEGTDALLYSRYWNRFITPLDIIGNTFTITMVFSKKKLTYKVSGLGKIVVKLPEALLPTEVLSKGIGTRSEAGDGPCVVYFDDVYVLK